MLIKEHQITKGHWYSISTVSNNPENSEIYYFKASLNGSGNASVHFSYTFGVAEEGDLTQKTYSAFRGNLYRILDSDEVKWAEECIKNGRYEHYSDYVSRNIRNCEILIF